MKGSLQQTRAAQPFEGWKTMAPFPGVARCEQPWALRRNPVGIKMGEARSPVSISPGGGGGRFLDSFCAQARRTKLKRRRASLVAAVQIL